jgi:hypothetical protein
METVDKETQKSWKTKAKEKSIRIKALEKESKRLRNQSQSYRGANKLQRLEMDSMRAALTTSSVKMVENALSDAISKKKIKVV